MKNSILASSIALVASGCGADYADPSEDLARASEPLVWSEPRFAPYTADSPDVANGGYGYLSSGEFGAESNSAVVTGETAAEGWIETAFSVPAFVRSATFTVRVRVHGGNANVGGLGAAAAGAWLGVSVRGSTGAVTCTPNIILAEEYVLSTRTIPPSMQTLRCTVSAPVGNVRVRSTLRAWTTAGGLTAAEANVWGNLLDVNASYDSGPEDRGDVLVTSLLSSRSAKVADLFCVGDDRCDVAENLTLSALGGAGPDLVAFRNVDSPSPASVLPITTAFPQRALGPAITTTSDVCARGEQCLLGDLNGDGRDDAVAIGSGGVGVSDGTSTGMLRVRRPTSVMASELRLPGGLVTVNLCGSGRSCALGDFDADGLDDFVAFNALGRTGTPPFVSLNGGAGTFSRVSATFVVGATDSSLCTLRACVVGDVNGDGADDLVDFAGAGGVRVAFSNGSGGFEASRVVLTDFCTNTTDDCQVSDVNADGRADLVHLNHLTGIARIAHFRGGAVFDPVVTRTTVCTGLRVCRVRGSDVFVFLRG